MSGARVAWAFLTRLPGGSHPVDGAGMAKAVPWFPMVGAVVGLMTGAAHLGLVAVVSPVVAALGAVGLGAILTGGFHEDGLADTFDSFGGYTRDRRLEIMHDSRIGTFGALALVIATGLKVGALAPMSGADGFGALVAAHTLGRAGALVVMTGGPDARRDGLAATTGEPSRWAVGGVLAALTLGALGLGFPTGVAVIVVASLARGMLTFARHQFGGVTGDVLGATEQIGEIATLVLVGSLVGDHGWLWA